MNERRQWEFLHSALPRLLLPLSSEMALAEFRDHVEVDLTPRQRAAEGFAIETGILTGWAILYPPLNHNKTNILNILLGFI